MNDIVGKMRGELRDILRDSVTDYITKSRDKWLFDWPSQIILVVNQIFWCQEVEQVSTLVHLRVSFGGTCQPQLLSLPTYALLYGWTCTYRGQAAVSRTCCLAYSNFVPASHLGVYGMLHGSYTNSAGFPQHGER